MQAKDMCVSLSDVAHYHPRLGMQMSTMDGSGVISEETYVWGDVSFSIASSE